MSLAGTPSAAVVGRAEGVPTRGSSLIAILLAKGLANEHACRAAIAACAHGEPLGHALVRTGAVSERDLATALAEASKTPLVSLEPYPEVASPIEPAERRLSSRRMSDPVPAHVARLLPRAFCEAHHVVLVAAHGDVGILAMADPFDTKTLRDAHRMSGLHLRRVTAVRAEIAGALERAWSDRALPVLPAAEPAARRALIAAELGVPMAVTAFLIAMRDALDLQHVLAVVALGCGLLFFVYAARYYIATAAVVGAVVFAASARWAVLRTGRSEGRDDEGYRMLRADPPPDQLATDRQPFVSVQVALYNEHRVVDRLLRACTSFDYERYEVIVADDSTDVTVQILERWKDHPRVRVLHRPDRRGFKGGALQEALKRMDPRTEFVMVFDADFVPPPDAICHFLDHFARAGGDAPDRVAAVQGYQWHILNASENWITRAIRAEFSGSYVLERAAQELFGAMKMISGSVYMIRADVLRRLGWSTSITEDWELTIRLYLAGYRVLYTPYIQSPAECVSRISQLIRQRMRWARGHTFNVRKYFGQVMCSPRIGWREKVEFLFYAPYYLQSVVLLLGTISWILGVFLLDQDLPQWGETLGWSLVISNILALPLMNLTGLVLEGSARRDAGGLLGSIALSMILVPFQAWAALCGVLDQDEGGWARTPKSGRVTEAIARLRLPRFLPWAAPRRAHWAPSYLTVIAVVAAVGILTVGALSLRAAAAGGAAEREELLVAVLGTALPLAGLLFGWRRIRRRAAAALIAFCVALTVNVVFLASTVPADATAGVSSTFVFRNATVFDSPNFDMEQGYTPGGAASQTPASLGNNWTATFGSDVFPPTASMSAGAAMVDLYGENNVAGVITYVGAGTVATAASSNVVPGLPTGWAQNDLFILVLETKDNVVSSVSGWTSLFEVNNGTSSRASVFYKVAGASESGPTVTHSGGNSTSAQILAFRGVDTTTPIDASGQLASGSDLNTEGPAITTTVPNTLLVFTTHVADNWTAVSWPSGWTQSFFSATAAGTDSAIGAAYIATTTAGSQAAVTMSRTGGGTSAVSNGAQIALRPATRNCTITATLKHVSGTTTTLGSGTGTFASPSSTSGAFTQITFSTSAVTFADGDRLRLEVSAPADATNCNARLHFDGASQQSKLVTATVVPEAVLALLLLAPALPPLARRLCRRRRPER